MNEHSQHAYSRKQWFWAVNLIALFGSLGVLLPVVALSRNFLQVLAIFPYAIVVALMVSCMFVAVPLAVAMRQPASWARAAFWGGAVATAIGAVFFSIGHVRRLRARSDDSINYQLGGGDFVRDIDGVLTPYGWQVIVQTYMLFIGLGIFVALVMRLLLGPGKSIQ